MSALVRWFREFVGPAALTAAGMIGAGAVATRLLAGAWFGFDLLWCALYVIPMVIFTLDSASRVAVMNGGRGMFDMIRSDIGAWLAWLILIPTVLVNVIVNMSQMSAMVEGSYGAVGLLPPASIDDSSSLLMVTVVATIVTLASAVLGGYKRVEKIMTALLLVILASFLVVAIKGLMDWSTWPALAGGLVPTVPPDVPVVALASATIAALFVNVSSRTYSIMSLSVVRRGIRSMTLISRWRMSRLPGTTSFWIMAPPTAEAE